MTKVLILLSTYNGEKFLTQQLDSLKNQEAVDVFCLVRDDGSKDSTVNILKKYKKEWNSFDYFEEKNIGCGSSFVSLMEKAKNYKDYKYFAFCDQDDVWLPNKLQKAIEKLDLKTNEEPSLYCSNLTLTDEKLTVLGNMYTNPIEGFTKGSLLVERIGTGCTMVFNQFSLNYFLENKPISNVLHDRWFVLILTFSNYNVLFDNNSYIYYRQHSLNVVGYNNSLISRLKSKYHSFFKLNENPRRDNARDLLKVCSDKITTDDIKLIKIVANFDKSLKNRLQFFFSPKKKDLDMSTRKLNFWFRLRILVGSV